MGFFSKSQKVKQWSDLPPNYCAHIMKNIYIDGWEWLMDLTRKHQLLEQPFFSNPKVFADRPDERMIPLALFLNSFGNQLAMQQNFSDAEKTFQLSLRLFLDDTNVAHASLAMVSISALKCFSGLNIGNIGGKVYCHHKTQKVNATQ